MDWGTAGDGLTRPRLIDLMMRNQLCDPAFAQCADKVLVPDTEALAMGDYPPAGTYTSRSAFEALGCCASPSGAFVGD